MITMSGIFPDIDLRIRPMLEGCFTDLYALLTNLRRALKDKDKVVFVIRNMHRTGIPNTSR